MGEAALFDVRNMDLSLPDLNARPLFGSAPKIDILKNVSLTIPEGQVTGIVGESGSGKSTLGRAVIRLLEPTGGSIHFAGQDITHLSPAALAPFRRNLQMIFQDPMSSLNPRHRIGAIISGPLRVNGAENAEAQALDALDRVYLGRDFANRYPHQLSGGQRQRVGIARAIALSPRFILCDEIVSGLDVSTQAQIMVLLDELVRDLNLTMAFISHDLSVIRRICSKVVVMRTGEIVEQGDTAQVFDTPAHPYTAELKQAIPLPVPDPQWLYPAPN